MLLYHVTSKSAAALILQTGKFRPFGMGSDRGMNFANSLLNAHTDALYKEVGFLIEWIGQEVEVKAGKTNYDSLLPNVLYKLTWDAITPGQVMRYFVVPGTKVVVHQAVELSPDSLTTKSVFSKTLPKEIEVIQG